jgi:hypothetical protein
VATLAATENGWKDIIVLEKAGTGGNSAMAHDLFGDLPKDKLGEIVPYLEDVLKYEYTTGWKHLMGKLTIYFDKTFGSYWKTKADVQSWY